MKTTFPRRRFACGTALGLAAVATVTPAHAAFHLWNIREIYSDATGTRQFIEFFDANSNENFVGGQQITVTPTGGGAAHVFTIPANLAGETANHAFLIATAGADTSGAPTPDFVLPDNFFFLGGGTISFFGANSGTYTALPTDGVMSRTWGDGNAMNTPQNFAGTIGVVVVPEPTSFAFLAAGSVGLFCLMRRRRA